MASSDWRLTEDELRPAEMSIPDGRAAPGLLGDSTAYDMLLDERRIMNGAMIRLPLLLFECTDVPEGNREGDEIVDVPLGDRRFAGRGGRGGTGSSLFGATRPAPTDDARFRLPGDLSGDDSFELGDGPDEKRFQNDGRFGRTYSVGGDVLPDGDGFCDGVLFAADDEATEFGVPLNGDGNPLPGRLLEGDANGTLLAGEWRLVGLGPRVE